MWHIQDLHSVGLEKNLKLNPGPKDPKQSRLDATLRRSITTRTASSTDNVQTTPPHQELPSIADVLASVESVKTTMNSKFADMDKG
ncbi:hypothetical protein ACOMHN_058923 [Nucella lapillus]